MTQSCTLSSHCPSSVGMTWSGCTAQCLWTSQHFYVGPQYVLLWLHSLSGPMCTKWLLQTAGAFWLQNWVMGGGKAMPRIRMFKPALPIGAFLTCSWFSLGSVVIF